MYSKESNGQGVEEVKRTSNAVNTIWNKIILKSKSAKGSVRNKAQIRFSVQDPRWKANQL